MKERRERGLTLVEVLISVLVVGAAAAALAAAYSTGLMAIRATRESATAVQAMQQEIENMRNTPFTGIASHSFSLPAPLNTTGYVVVENVDTALKKVSVNIQWVSGGRRTMSVNTVTYMANGGINRK